MMTNDQVTQIFILRGDGHSIRAIAGMMDTSHTVVHKILTRTSFANVEVDAIILAKAQAVDDHFRDRYRDRMTPDDLGYLVKYKRQGMTQVEIAEQLGVSQPCVSRWLKRIRTGELI